MGVIFASAWIYAIQPVLTLLSLCWQLATRLQRLGPEDSQFIYDAACDHCMEVATHRHGCCVLQRCIDFANGQQRRRLVNEISSNALVLSQVHSA